jgi:hypothetical protein
VKFIIQINLFIFLIQKHKNYLKIMNIPALISPKAKL